MEPRKNPGSLGGANRGGGYILRGGLRKTQFLVCTYGFICRQNTNLLQFFVGEEPLLHASRAF